MFTIITPATDLHLLDNSERRQAAGVTTSASDALLESLSIRCSSVIAGLCGIRRGGVAVPTIKSEVVSEVFRPDRADLAIALGRRFVTAVASVTVAGRVLAGDEFEVEPVSGLLYRLNTDERVPWDIAKTTVQYTAGFATVPDDIKMAASRLLAAFFRDNGRDPSVKRERVEGVGDFEYAIGANDDPGVPAEVVDLLGPYMHVPVG